MKKIHFLISILGILISTIARGQYDIKLTVKNMPEEEVTLAYYYDNKIYVQEKIRLNRSGVGNFKSKEKKLARGVYMIYFSPSCFLDIIIGDDQSFSLECDTADMLYSAVIEKSDENKSFLDFQRFVDQQNKKRVEILKNVPAFSRNLELSVYNPELKLEYSLLLDELDSEMRKYVAGITIDYPGSVLATFANFMLLPKIPDFSKEIPENAEDPQLEIHKKSLDYARAHYWDYTNFTDTALLRTPLLKQKLDYYFENLVYINADSLFISCDNLLEKSQPSKGMFKYLMEYCMVNTIDNMIMGMDKAFVRLGQKYYLSGKVDWHKDEELNKITYEIVKRQYNLIGQKAIDLKLPSMENGQVVSLHEVEAPFVIVMFWEADCKYCKEEIALTKQELYDRFSPYGLKIFSVHTTENKDSWSQFVDNHELYDYIHCWDPKQTSNYRTFYNVFGTPVYYILDKDKKIIAKNLVIEQMVEFLKKEYKKMNIQIKS